MHRLAFVTCTALVLAFAPLAGAGESCAKNAAAAAAADPPAESKPDVAVGCKEDGACCADAACAEAHGDQASAAKQAKCPCGRVKEKQL